MPGRRTLDFDRIDAIMPDVDRLLEGHTTVGPMVARHDLRPPREGRPGRRSTAEVTAAALDPRAGRGAPPVLRRPRDPQGRAVPIPILEPDPEADGHEAAEMLRDALAASMPARAPGRTTRRLGPLGRDEWRQFHAIHCAHHLSFAHPA